MGRGTEVPITPSVLVWAIDESGFELPDIARSIDVSDATLQEWIDGKSKPKLSEARKLASKLHRPFAAFLLPSPPPRPSIAVHFRHPIDESRELNPTERRYLRKAARMQEVLSWLARELNLQRANIPSVNVHESPAGAAEDMRRLLRVSIAAQQSWPSPAAAFDEWRTAIERIGVLVFLFPLGKRSCRGFSLWEEHAPTVSVNTAWNESARIFTLFHEMGHLVSRTSSACLESVRTGSRVDAVERWCERFAADLLMPQRDVALVLHQRGWSNITTLEPAKTIANAFKVSLRAAVIRLIELSAASWSLYDEIPAISDQKPPGGGGSGRDRTQIREDQFGSLATSLLATAVNREVLSRSQAVSFLDIPDMAFDQITPAGGSR